MLFGLSYLWSFLIANSNIAPTMAIAIIITTAAPMIFDVLSGIAVSGRDHSLQTK